MIKAKSRPQKDRSERWLLTYADLITLLMVFFVILYSFSIIDVRKFLNLKGSLDKAFHQGVLSGVSTTGLETTISGSSVQEQISASNRSAQASLATELQQLAEASGLGEAVTVTQVTQGINVSLAANLLFQSGTADLKPGAADLIGQIAVPLRDLPNPIEIIANTDDVPPAPTNSKFKDNWELGSARAFTVLNVLTTANKFPEERLSIGNNGSYSPLYANDSAENRAKNRRVDVLIVFPSPNDQSLQAPFQLSPQSAGGGAPA